VCCSCGNKWGTCRSKSSWGSSLSVLRHRVILRDRYSENPLYWSRREHRASVLEPRNKSPVFAFAQFSFSLSLSCLYLAYAYCSYLLYAWSILWLIDIHAWVCVLTLIFNQESHSDTSTLNLEESWGDSTESFTGNLVTLLYYTLCVSLIVLVCIISFNFALVCIWLACHLFTPPLGDLQLISELGAIDLGLTTLS